MLQNTIIDESTYNQSFLYLSNQRLTLTELLSELNIANELPLYMDISLYLDEFIRDRHSNNHINIYSVTISDDGQLVISNKKIHKGNLNV